MPASLPGMNSGVPSPSASNASATAGLKRKRNGLPNAVQTEQAKNPGAQEFVTQMRIAEEYLKETGKRMSFTELANYLSIQFASPEKLSVLKMLMMSNHDGSKISYDPKGANGAGTFKYKPILPVESAEDLKGYLQRRGNAVGVKVDDLKDGWKACIPEIERMVGVGELLVVRNRNAQPRTVWQNDPTMLKRVDDDIQKQWHMIQLPGPDELRSKLEMAGLKPTSAPRQVSNASGRPQEKKRKAPRKGGRQTNVHMAHLLKDYSHKRK